MRVRSTELNSLYPLELLLNIFSQNSELNVTGSDLYQAQEQARDLNIEETRDVRISPLDLRLD
jgi:hypothetical protein